MRKLQCQYGGHFRKTRWKLKKSGETAVGYQCYNRSSKSNGVAEKCNVAMVTDWKLKLLVKAVVEDIAESAVTMTDDAIIENYIEQVLVKGSNLFEVKVNQKAVKERIFLYRISGSKKNPLIDKLKVEEK